MFVKYLWQNYDKMLFFQIFSCIFHNMLYNIIDVSFVHTYASKAERILNYDYVHERNK